MPLKQTLSRHWFGFQRELFPWLEEALGPLGERYERLVRVLELVRVEELLPYRRGWRGRPLEDRAALARGFLAKAVLDLATTLEVIEAALAHVARNRVEAAYARSDLFERRRVLMDDRARYLARGIGCPHQAKKRQALIVRPNRRPVSEAMESPSKAATRRPRPQRDGSTISASGGHARAVVWVATLQGWGGASRWCTILTTTNLHYQRAQPSPLWSRLCLETRIGRGLARIPRVLWGKAQCGATPARPRLTRRAGAPHGRGRWWRERPPVSWRWCATGQGEVVRL